MSESDNRSASNLIPLCLEHAAEIDTRALVAQYPAETLRNWKVLQQQEFDEAHRGFVLGDNEVADLGDASFASQAHETIGTTAELARLTQRLLDTAADTRSWPASRAAEWHQAITTAQARTTFIDEDGNPYQPEVQLSRDVTDRYRTALEEALVESSDQCGPIARALRAEAAALTAVGGTEIQSWCEWLVRAADSLTLEIGNWRDDGNHAFEAARNELQRAMTATSARAVGGPGEDPPEIEPEPVEAPEDTARREAADMVVGVTQILEHAQLWGRVDNRPYDDEVHAALITIAPVVDSLPEDFQRSLKYVAGLAARVARNASAAELQTVLGRLSEIAEIHIRLAFETEFAEIRRNDSVTSQLQQTHTLIRSSLPADATTKAFWQARPIWLLAVVADNDPDAALKAVDAALDHELLCHVLNSIAQTTTGADGGRLIIHPDVYRPISFIDNSSIREAIASRFPETRPSRPPFSYSIEDQCQRLAAEFLSLPTETGEE